MFASQGKNRYYDERIALSKFADEKITAYQGMIANEKDFLATRVSFKLNLLQFNSLLKPCLLKKPSALLPQKYRYRLSIDTNFENRTILILKSIGRYQKTI